MANSFTNEPWDVAEVSRGMSAEDYCRITLIDANPEGVDKIKDNCKLPVRTSPDGPYSRAAIRNAMGRIFTMKGVDADAKREAARRLVRLAAEAGVEVGPSVLRLAGMKAKK